MEHTAILLDLFIMLAAAKLMAEIFERLKQPAVVGEILAGVVIGPSLLRWVEPSEMIGVLAEFGVIFLLFNVGLETKPQSIFQVGRRAAIVGVAGVALPFVAGYFLAHAWGGSFIESMFIAAACTSRLSRSIRRSSSAAWANSAASFGTCSSGSSSSRSTSRLVLNSAANW